MTPHQLRNHAGELELQWPTHTQHLTHLQLRAACPCAKCRAARLRGELTLVDAEIKLQAVNPMGYGVQLVFSDGHDKGIFPWAYLAAMM